VTDFRFFKTAPRPPTAGKIPWREVSEYHRRCGDSSVPGIQRSAVLPLDDPARESGARAEDRRADFGTVLCLDGCLLSLLEWPCEHVVQIIM